MEVEFHGNTSFDIEGKKFFTSCLDDLVFVGNTELGGGQFIFPDFANAMKTVDKLLDKGVE